VRHAQQPHIVVSKHTLRVEPAGQAQHAGGVLAAVDEITEQHEHITGWIVAQPLEQLLEFLAAAVHIADHQVALHEPQSSV
jgi:hypothetical protein